MRPYLQHGRRHGPSGSDPIPGLGGAALVYAFDDGEDGTFSDTGFGSTQRVSLTSGDFETNDSSVYASASYGGDNGIQINAVGTYEVAASAYALASGTPASGAALSVGVEGFAAVRYVAASEVGSFVERPDSGWGTPAYWANCFQIYLVQIGVPANPTGTIAFVAAGQSAGLDVDLSVSLYVKQINAADPSA